MVTYNFTAEWAVLPILISILISFHRDYEANSTRYRLLRIMYCLALLTTTLTIITSFYNQPLESQWQVVWGYVWNTVYFVSLPSMAMMYGVYGCCAYRSQFSVGDIWKKLTVLAAPYVVYVLVLLMNIHNGRVFSVTAAEGYVRGPWYQLPYPVVGFYVLWVIATVVKNAKALARDTVFILVTSMGATLFILAGVYANPNIIVTGLVSTTCILIIHLYVLNVRKTEDILTRVQNRLALLYELAKKIKANREFSLYVFSVRGMKQVNEQYGLQVGDKTLHYVADTFLRHVPREKVFRYSGDEFALLLPYCADVKLPYLDGLESAFDVPAQVEEFQIPIQMVVVRVDYPAFGTQVQDLISAADYGIHLLKNKNTKGIRYLYDLAVANEMRTQHAITQELHTAIQNHRFVVHYQPIYHVLSDAFTQAEALIRMEKQDGSLMYPNDFIDLANSTGLVVEMTYQMLDQVCRDFRYLLTCQPDTTLEAISINVPYLQFTDPDMENRFLQILQRYDIAPSQIKIEITERIIVTDLPMMMEKMAHMQEQGFSFELDDFGTDYSNLKMCLTLPMEIIKLDRSILLAALESEAGRSFFHHILAGIRSTGRKTLLEGVETQAQLRWAKECQCDYIQGYYFSRPVDFQRFSALLRG